MIRLEISPVQGGPSRFAYMRDDSLVVGRSEHCDVTVTEDPFLSRRHARFFWQDGELRVEDLGSSNGTWINGRRITEASPVSPGDTVLLSQTELKVQEVSAEVETVNEPLPEATLLRPLEELLPRDPGTVGESERDASALRRYSERLELLNELHRALGRSLDLEELLRMVLDGAFEHLGPTEGRILLQDADGTLRVAASRTVESADPKPISRTLIREVVDQGKVALVADTHRDDRFSGARSMLIVQPKSLVAAPLADAEGCMGMIAVSAPLSVRVFGEEDLSLLASLASVAALRIRNASLAEAARERARLETELGLARGVQVSLLPRQLPEMPGWEIHASNVPSRGVSGDYYQLLTRDDGRECVLTVADVCGKGMSAALLTATIEAVSSALAEAGDGLGQIASKTNHFVHRRTTPDKYATAFLAAIGEGPGIRYVNAGHVTPVVLRAGEKVEELEATGFPIGLTPDAEYEVRELELAPGDLLVLYTDGIVEAENPAGEEFGLLRLLEVLRRERRAPLAAIDESLDAALTRFGEGVPLYDDRTLLLLRRVGGN